MGAEQKIVNEQQERKRKHGKNDDDEGIAFLQRIKHTLLYAQGRVFTMKNHCSVCALILLSLCSHTTTLPLILS